MTIVKRQGIASYELPGQYLMKRELTFSCLFHVYVAIKYLIYHMKTIPLNVIQCFGSICILFLKPVGQEANRNNARSSNNILNFQILYLQLFVVCRMKTRYGMLRGDRTRIT